jgi:hypothetical protein
MPGSLTGTLSLGVDILDSRQIGAEVVKSQVGPRLLQWTVAPGTGVGLADLKWTSLSRALAASANEDHDLAGALLDAFGVAVVFAKLKALYVFNTTALGGNRIRVGRGATNGVPWISAASAGVDIGPQSGFGWFDLVGITVTPTTGDLINVLNTAGVTGVTYDIYLGGSSA